MVEGQGISVTDDDAGGSGVIATLNVGEGILTVVSGDSGVLITGGNGTGNVNLSGTIVQINNLLTGTGTGNVTYLNNSDAPGPSTIMTVTINDLGNSGSDPGLSGDGVSEEGTNSVTINITPINDAPTINSAAGYGVNEDDNYRLFGGISIEDVDAGVADLQVTIEVNNGVLLIQTSTP